MSGQDANIAREIRKTSAAIAVAILTVVGTLGSNLNTTFSSVATTIK
jgi:hypothetical protein